MNNILNHHEKYKTIHGVEKTKDMTHSEHRKLHSRLRREGKCNIPADILSIISKTERRNKYYEQKFLNLGKKRRPTLNEQWNPKTGGNSIL